MGIAVWGTEHYSPQEMDRIGYTDGTVSHNLIDQVKPVETKTNQFGGIALKLTGKAPTSAPTSPGMVVENNQIGLDSTTPVQLAGVAAIIGNQELALKENQIGKVTYEGDPQAIKATDIDIYEVGPIVLRGKDNRMDMQNNLIDAANTIAIQDDRYGTNDRNYLTSLESNQWTDVAQGDRLQDLSNLGLVKVNWDAEAGKVTGVAGDEVGYVEIQQPNSTATADVKSALEDRTHTPVTGTKIAVDATTHTFTIQADILKQENLKNLYVVARNKAPRPTSGKNSTVQYKVSGLKLTQASWYAITPEAYDVTTSTQLKGTTGDEVKQVRVWEAQADGSSSTLATIPVQQGAFVANFHLPHPTAEDVYRNIWLEGQDTNGQAMTTVKLPLQDARIRD